MGVVVVMEIRARPEAIGDLEEFLTGMLPGTQSFEGCEGVTAHRQVDDPLTFVLVERWRARSFYDSYVQWRIERGDLDAFPAMLAGRPWIRHFDRWEP